MKKRHNKTPASEIIEIILQRLALNPQLLDKTNLTIGLTRYQIKKGTTDDSRSISQAAILEYTKELEKQFLIQPVSRSKFGTGKDRISYDITALGLVKWFHYLSNQSKYEWKLISQVITKSKRLLPFIANNWADLKEIFKSELVLISVLLESANMDINYYDKQFAGFLVTSPLKIGFLSTHINNQMDIRDPKTRNDVYAIRNNMVAELFTFVFLYRMSSISFSQKISREESRAKIFSLIKTDVTTNHAYLKFIKQIQRDVDSASKYIKNIENSLKIIR